MPIPLLPGGHPVAIMHRISGGSKFNGKLPATVAYAQNGINKFEPGTDGGLFFFYNHKPVTVPHYNVDFGAEVDYELSVVSMDADATTVMDRVLIDKGRSRVVDGANHYGFTLGAYQAFELKVVSTAATSAPMIATFWVVDATAFFS